MSEQNHCPICDRTTKRETRDGKTGDWCDPCKSLSLPIEEILKPVKEEIQVTTPIPEPGQKTSFYANEWHELSDPFEHILWLYE